MQDATLHGDAPDDTTPRRGRMGVVLAGTILVAAGVLPRPGDVTVRGAPDAASMRAGVASPADTTELDAGRYGRMYALLERTLFQVDVAELTLRYDSATAGRVRGLVRNREFSEPLTDSVAGAVLGAERVHGRLEFLRGVGLDQFLESLRQSMEKARDADLLADSAYRSFRGQLRGWYAALEGRGVEEGDVTEYRIRGDTLRVIYRSGGGDVLIDRTDIGGEHRRAVLGGYLAPGSDFREGLIRSLFRADEPGS